VILAPAVLGQQPTPIFPDPKLTSGDSFPVTVQDLCVPGYTKKVRNVPAEDDSTLDLTIVDPGNAVVVRDKNNQVEYLG
jgi:hypothetical protein